MCNTPVTNANFETIERTGCETKRQSPKTSQQIDPLLAFGAKTNMSTSTIPHKILSPQNAANQAV